MTAAAQSGLPADPLREHFRLRSLCAAMSKKYYHFQSGLSADRISPYSVTRIYRQSLNISTRANTRMKQMKRIFACCPIRVASNVSIASPGTNSRLFTLLH